MPSRWYHGTTPENWAKIQAEGVLWGWPCPRCVSSICGDCTQPRSPECQDRRYTYLTPDLDVALTMGGPVVLEVDYEPVGPGTGVDNYGFNPPPGEHCWQFSVFVPIPLDQVTVYHPQGSEESQGSEEAKERNRHG